MNCCLHVKKMKPVLLLAIFTVCGALFSNVSAQINPTPQTLPYTQNFSSLTGSTTTYPVGWQGWAISGSASTSYSTAVPTSVQTLTPTMTNATNSGVIGDMNGKLGIMTTGSAIRAACLAINTSGITTGVIVSFVAQTQRQETGARVSEMTLQYRTDTTSTFTSLNTTVAYQNILGLGGNTTGTGSLLTRRYTISLPSACNNKAIVQLRWILRDVSGSGNRPSFSIDDVYAYADPYITSLSSASANPGSSITINGNYFNTTLANNLVNFGGIYATPSSGSSTSLTVTVPNGANYGPISVTNTALGAVSTAGQGPVAGTYIAPFRPSYTNTAFISDSINFKTKVDFSVGTMPYGVATGDVDGDGKIDMLSYNYASSNLTLLLNTSSGGTINSSSFTNSGLTFNTFTGAGPTNAKLVDIDGDGKLDIVVALSLGAGNSRVHIWKNNTTTIGSPSFGSRFEKFVIGLQSVLGFADFDGDSHTDMAVTQANFNTFVSNIAISKSSSVVGVLDSFSFNSPASSLSGGSYYQGITLADFNRDGKADIAAADLFGNRVNVHKNLSTLGTIAFGSAINLTAGTQTTDLQAADLDGDGYIDIAATNRASSTISLFRNTSTDTATVSFAAASTLTLSSTDTTTGITLADFDGNGKIDIAVSNANTNSIKIYRNQSSSGSFTFASPITLTTGTKPLSLTSADFDNDGYPDLAVANATSNTISVFENYPLPNISPSTGTATVCVGSTTTFSNATTGTATFWQSANTSVATVNSSTGVVTGVSAGSADIRYYVVAGGDTNFIARTVTVNPLPSVATITPTDSTLCIGGTLSLSDATAGGSWTIANATATINSSGVVSGVSAGTNIVTYTYTDVNGCTNYATKNIIINSSPTSGTITGSSTVCEGATTTLTNATALYGTGSWTSSNISIATIGSTNGVVYGVAGGTATITYTNTGCGSASTTFEITVNPLPVVNAITGSTTTCVGFVTTLSSTTGGGSWSSSNTSVATINPSSGVYVSASSGNAIITYSVTNSCGTSTDTAYITVNALPSAGTITGSSSTCIGNTVTLSNVTASGGTGAWSSSNTTVATVDATSGVVYALSTGTTTISYTVTSTTGCGSANAIFVFDVSSSASLDPITGTTTVCAGATTTLSNPTPGGSWTSSNTGTATVNSSGVVFGVSAGTTTISYTISTSCGSATETSVVTVTDVPTAPASITGTTTVCLGSTTTLNSTTPSGVWSSSNNTIATVDASGVVYSVSVGSSTISYTVTNSCGSTSTTAVISVITVPSVPSITGTTTICNGSSSTLSNALGGGTWSTSDAATATVDGSGIVTGLSVGSTNITYTVTNTCGSSYSTIPVSIITTPSTPASITGTTTICFSGSTTLSSATPSGVWTSSNTSVATVDATSGVVYGVSDGTTTISYTVSNSCGSTSTSSVMTIENTLSSPDAISGTLSLCQSATTTLSNTTPGGTWSSTNTSVATINSSGIVFGVSGGSATISYTLTNTCGSVASTAVATVTALPSTPAAITGTTTLLVGYNTTLSSATAGGTWSSSNAAIATINSSGVVTALSAGTTTISYGVSNSCGTSYATTTFTVNGISFTSINGTQWNGMSGSSPAGASTFTVVPGATSPGTSSMNVSQWNRVGATNSTGTAIYNSTGFSTATSYATAVTENKYLYFTVTNGSNTEVKLTNISLIGQRSTSGPTSFQIAYSTGSSGNILFGSAYTTVPTSSGTMSVTGSVCIAPGQTDTFKVVPYGASAASGTLRIINGTSMSATYINGASALAVSASTSSSPVCEASTLNLTGGVASNGVPGYSYSWSGPSSYSSTVASPSISSVALSGAGTYTFTVTDTMGCTAINTTAVNINPLPVVSAISGSSTLCVGSSTTFTDTATSGTWSSSDLAIATVSSGGVVFGVSSGSATITFTKTNSCGTTFATKSITIIASPTTDAITGTTTLCTSATTTLSNSVVGGTWTSSNTSVATIDAGSGVVYGVSAGNSTISYTNSNSCGSSVATAIITVNTAPSVDAITGTLSACSGSTSTLSNTTPSGSWSSTNTSVATIDASGIVYAIAGGSTTISYTVSNSCGNTSVTSIFSVTATPTSVAAITGTTSFCNGFTTTLSTASVGGGWSSSNEAVATVSSEGVVYGISSGTSTISYIISNSCGTASNYTVVTVSDAPSVSSISGSTSICNGTTTTYTNSTPAGSWASSAPSVITINASTGIANALSVGTSTLTYTISTGCGTVYATSTITVLDIPSPASISGTTTICSGTTSTLTNATVGGTWSSSNMAVATIDASGILYGTTAGNTTISYSVTNICGTGYTSSIATIENTLSTPSSITGSTTLCSGSTSTLSSATVGGAWSSSNTSVATITSEGIVYGVSSGTSSISYTVTNSCGSASTFTVVTINTIPSAPSAITGTTTLYVGASTTLSSATVGGTWSVASATIATINSLGVLSGLSAGSTTATYTVSNTCGNNYVTSSITVNSVALSSISGTAWNGFTGSSAAGASTFSVVPAATSPGSSVINVSQWNRFGTSNSSGTGFYNTSNFSTATSYSGALTDNRYIYFTITNNSNTEFKLTSIALATQRSSTGPTTAQIAYSTGASGNITYGSAITGITTTAGTYTVTASLCIPPNTTDTFKVFGYNAGATGGALRITNGTSITGTYITGVSAMSLASVSIPSPTCYGTSVTLSSSVNGGVPGYSYAWSGPSSYSASTLTTNISSATAANAGTYSLVATDTLGCTATTTVNLSLNYLTWTGSTSSNWHTASNWNCGTVPTVSDDIIIPSGTTYSPVVSSSSTANSKGLTINSSAALLIDTIGVLNVKGSVVNNASVTGKGSIILNGSTNQNISGIGAISNLELNNTSGATIQTGSRQTISNTLTITNGTLTTNDSLVLSASSTGTARVAPIASGSISGKVQTQLYIQGGRRAYRFLSHPFSSAMSLSELIDDIDITGTGGATNGFTTTGSNASSAFWYNPLYGNSALSYDPGWRSVNSLISSSDTNWMQQYQGMRIFFRGSKGEGLGYASYTPSPVTISMKGNLNQGNQIVRMSKGSSSNQDYNLIGNPYASPVDIGTIAHNAKVSGNMAGAAIYVWNPYMATSGLFQAVPVSTVSATPYYLPANGAFEIRAMNNNDSLVFNESNKNVAASTTLLRKQPEYVTLSISDANNHPYDMLYIKFDNNAPAEEDIEQDALKLLNSDFNFYTLSSDNKKLSIDTRPYKIDGVIPVGITSKIAQDYVIKAENVVIPDNSELYLHDKLSNKYIQLSEGASYKFHVSEIASSQGDSRLELLMRKSNTSETNASISVNITPNPTTDKVNISISNMKPQNITINVIGMNGVSIYNTSLGNVQNVTKSIDMSNFASGIYIIELNIDGRIQQHKVNKN